MAKSINFEVDPQPGSTPGGVASFLGSGVGFFLREGISPGSRRWPINCSPLQGVLRGPRELTDHFGFLQDQNNMLIMEQ